MKKILFLILFALPLMGYSSHFYASTSAGGSNSGTLANPYTSISSVNSHMSSFNPGDEISFKRGDTFSGRLNITSAGTVGNPVVFDTYSTGAAPIFHATGTECIQVLYSSAYNGYVTIDGFNITDLTFDVNDKATAAPCEQGIRIGAYPDFIKHDVIIQNCSFSNIGGGVVITGNNCTIQYCNFSNMKNIKSTLGTDANHNGTIEQSEPNADDDYGANDITLTGDDNLIWYNDISGGWADSQDYGYNGGAVEMFDNCSRNRILYNRIHDCGGVSEYGAKGTNASATDNLYAFNIIENCGNLTWVNFSGTFSIDATNIQYFNNTIIENNNSRFSGPNTGAGLTQSHALLLVQPEADLLAFSSGAPSATIYVLKNNIFNLQTGEAIVRNSTIAAKTVHQNNLLKNNAAPNYTLASSEASTTAAVFVNTTSSDPVNWDLHLKDGSPAIDKGQVISGLTTDYDGITLSGTREAGVYQYDPPGGCAGCIITRHHFK